MEYETLRKAKELDKKIQQLRETTSMLKRTVERWEPKAEARMKSGQGSPVVRFANILKINHATNREYRQPEVILFTETSVYGNELVATPGLVKAILDYYQGELDAVEKEFQDLN